MNPNSSSEKEVQSLSIVRQPVFDLKNRLWGYQLFCVGSQGPVCSGFTGANAGTIAENLATSAFIGLKQVTEKGMKLMVDYTSKNLFDHMPYALPPDLAAVAVTEDFADQPEIFEILNKLRKDGYTIIIRNFTADTRYENIYQLAHIFAVDARNTPLSLLSKVMSIARNGGIPVMAMELENQNIYKQYQNIGFDYFHGPFFKSTDELILRKLSVNETSRFKLLKLAEKKDPDISRIVEALQADAALSFRLLSYLNSAAFGFRQKVKSIQQAVSLLGWRKLKNWMRVVLLGELNLNKHASALMFMAAQRGKFLEIIATENDYWGFDPDSLHLLGMFSLLDAMLQIQMSDIVDHLPIEAKLKAALLNEPNNEYLPLIQLAQALEDVKWDSVEPLINRLNLKLADVTNAFQASMEWALRWLEVQETQTEGV